MTTRPYSFYDSLVKLPPKSYGPSDLIKQQLELYGHEVCDVKRNTLTAYSILDRSRALYDVIIKLIQSTDTSSPDWADYDKYTAAIDPLEDFLFRLLDYARAEVEIRSSATTGIQHYLERGNDWRANRAACRKLQNELFANATFVQLLPQFRETIDTKKAARHDDISHLSSLCNTILTYKPPTYPSIPTRTNILNNIANFAHKIIDTSPDYAIAESVRFINLVVAMIELSASSIGSAQTRALLVSPQAWNKALETMNGFDPSHAERDEAGSQELIAKVDELMNLLLSLLGESATVLRTSVVLVATFRELEAGVASNSELNTDMVRAAVKALFQNVQKLLQDASDAVPDVATLANSAKDGIGKRFTETEKAIVDKITELKIKRNNGNGKTLLQAQQEDDRRVKQLGDLVKGGRLLKIPTPELVTLTIRRGGKSPEQVQLRARDRLSAVFWKEGSEDSSMLHGWQLRSNGKPVDLNAEAKDYANVAANLEFIKI